MAALVQSATSYNTSGSSTSLAFTSNVTAGNTIVVCTLAPVTGSSVTDSQGNVYSQAPSGNIWYSLNAKGGATTVTVNFGTSPGWLPVILSEFTKASSGGGFDQSSYATGTSTTPTGGSITPAVANELVVGYCTGGNNATAGTGYTLIDNSTGDTVEYGTHAGTSALQTLFALASSATWYIQTATFKPLGGTAYTKTLTEAFTLAESKAQRVSRGVTEAFTLTDRGVARTTGTLKTDGALALTDLGILRTAGKYAADTLALAESIGKSTGRTVTEAFSLATSLTKATVRTVSETFGLADLVAVTRAKVLVLSDTLSGFADSLVRSTSRSVAEAFSLADVLTTARAKVLVLVDSINLAEAFTRSTARQMADALGMSDAFSVIRTKLLVFAESIGLADAITRATGKTLNDTLSLADRIERLFARELDEAIALADVISRAISRSFAETFHLFDALVRNIIGASDALRRFVAQILQRFWSAETPLRTQAVLPVARHWSANEIMITSDPKDTEAVEDFELDWSLNIAPDTIASSAWELPADLTLAAETNTTTTATARIAGGVAGKRYVVKNLITLASGQIKAQSILLPIT